MTMQQIAKQLVAPGKGILAADESTGTIGKRFDKISVANIEDNRRAYREIIFTAPEMEKYISGVIMFDETIHQKTNAGKTFVKVMEEKGVIPGIKVDKGTVAYNNSEAEKITQGLEGLNDRMKEHYQLGAKFAKWRAVYVISDVLPSDDLINENARTLAEYAYICQQNDIVPIVEPEVLMDGSHDIDKCYEVTRVVQLAVFKELKAKGVKLDAMLLKPNMVISGQDAQNQAQANHIAQLTVKCLLETVPKEVPGIVFLSGGQSEQQACETLNEIAKISGNCPWQLSFSYGRALQNSTLKTWAGKPQNFKAAQEAFIKQVKLVSLAREGKYKN